MRITQNITAQNSIYNLQQGRAKLDKLQETVALGANINRPSDDPIGASLLLSIGDQVKAGDYYASNIKKASTFLDFTSTALQGIADNMKLAKKVIASMSGGSNDQNIIDNAVSQLKTFKQQIVDMGNTQLGDQYVFGGANGVKPFDGTVSASPYYAGDETVLNVQIGQSTTQQMNIPGNQLLAAGASGESVSKPYGSVDILKAFDDMITAVGANDTAQIKAGAQTFEDGANQITKAQTDVASWMTRLDSTLKMNTNSRNTMNIIVGNMQNVDYAKLAVELQQQQTAFQASLSATAKVTQLSLLDYMQ
jgi:flagellar hook-associated protein 3 FlgL